MGMTWTDDQKKVIDLRNRDILVSAAAGSGKTAVLVARILAMVMDEVHPVDIDHLLIVTFTNAAAGEMKERIRDAIEKALEDEPDNSHLQKQLTLVHHAQITTIHSFCQHVIRNYFHTIDLDPSFRIGDEGEMKLLRMDVVEQLLEEAYEQKDAEFLHFIECFASGKSDQDIPNLILQLYEFSMSYPWPETWLSKCADAYQIENAEELCKADWMQAVVSNIRLSIEEAEELTKAALQICKESDGPYMYEDALTEDGVMLKNFMRQEDYAAYAKAFSEKRAYKKLSAKKDDSVSVYKKELVKALRDQMKKSIKAIEEQYFFETPEQMAEDMREAGRAVRVLTALTIDFSKRFSEKKREKNLLDFNDLEHLALKILVKEEEGEAVPTEAARQFSRQFEEIMIDEYQDSNLVQEYILTSVSRKYQGKHNLFMVGDVKQSIYRFRLARPELFMEKYATYTEEESDQTRIELHQNFRSRVEVLNGVNEIFRCIMRQELGNICYDDNAALYLGASFLDEEEKTNRDTEILLFHADEESEAVEETGENKKELEARMIGKRIREIVGHERVLDKETGTYRPAAYRDIVILLRTISGWAEPMAAILAELGIPAYTGSRTGYFSAVEIQTVLALLKVIDNPDQDIPLAAVLHSGIVGLSEEELAKIKSASKDSTYLQACRQYLEMGTDELLREKLKHFFGLLQDFRSRVSYTPMHELLWYILEKTGYQDYAAAMPAGEQRVANLNMLVEKAIAYESTSYRGLFNFVRYIEQLKKYEVDFGEAGILGEEDDTVRILSIHKSKGLEYPIVFVAGMAKQFNRQDSQSKLALHPELGLGCDCIDPLLRTKAPTLLRKVIQKQITYENLGEELRVLYVAMTRAKEKLILTAAVQGLEKKLKKWTQSGKKQGTPLSFGTLSGAQNYLDWVMPVVLTYPSGQALLKELDIETSFAPGEGAAGYPIRLMEIGELAREEALRQLQGRYTRDYLLHWENDGIHDRQLHEFLQNTFSYTYPWEKSKDIYGKISVSEVKRFGQQEAQEEELVLYEEPEIVPLIPNFRQEKEPVRGAARGTIYHKVLEHLDFGKEVGKDMLHEQLEQMKKSQKLTAAEAEVIEQERMLRFLRSPLAQRMQKAARKGNLYREQPFVLGMKASDIRKEWTGEDMVLVQGIMDAYFEEEEALVLVDYKTDFVPYGQEQQLVEKYGIQLRYYADALERLTGKRVKEKIIYSFSVQKELRIP